MIIINKLTGEEISNILNSHSMSLDEAIELVGEIFPENEEENVLIDGKWYYYDDLELTEKYVVFEEDDEPRLKGYDLCHGFYDSKEEAEKHAKYIRDINKVNVFVALTSEYLAGNYDYIAEYRK